MSDMPDTQGSSEVICEDSAVRAPEFFNTKMLREMQVAELSVDSESMSQHEDRKGGSVRCCTHQCSGLGGMAPWGLRFLRTFSHLLNSAEDPTDRIG